MTLEESSNQKTEDINREIEADQKILDLVQAAKKDQNAFYFLYLHFVDRIYFYILRRVGSHHDAEDLSSEVFIRAMKHIHRFDERNSFAAWLFRIARNLTVDHYRANRTVLLNLNDENFTLAEKSPDTETMLQLKDQLRKLEPDELDLLNLRYTARLTFVEMGQLLGKRPDAVRKAHNKILEHLRLNLE